MYRNGLVIRGIGIMSVSRALRYENLSIADTCIFSKRNFIPEMRLQFIRLGKKKAVKRFTRRKN